MSNSPLRLDSSAGRWTIAASVLGSGAAFLETTVVNVALPSIARDFGTGIEGLQWVLDGYLLALGALMLFGGSLGDVFSRRRVFAAGLVGFAMASLLCAFAPWLWLLVTLRLLQGAAGAMLVPNSLALLEELFVEEDRGTAIGRWAGWSAVSTALGPLAGGWLVDALGWRWVFGVIVPFALAAAWVVLAKIPESAVSRSSSGTSRYAALDMRGAVLGTLGLAGVVAALIEGPGRGFGDPLILAIGVGGMAFLVLFVLAERRTHCPLLPLGIFRSRQFSGANLVTLCLYAALGGVFFLLMVELQSVLGYGALKAGASLLPINGLMLVLSPAAGRFGERHGPRIPMAAGALVAGAGALLLTRIHPGTSYLGAVLPAVLVFGLGLSFFVAPLTSAVLGAVDSRQAGIASAINNAAARVAGLVATALLPALAGLGGVLDLGGARFEAGFPVAMMICSGLCLAAAVVAWWTVERASPVID